MAKVLVTGGCGFIGSHLVDELVKRKHEVFVVDIADPDKLSYKNKKAFYSFSYVEGLDCSGLNSNLDIRNYVKIDKLFRYFTPEYVFHCAALARIQQSFQNPRETYETNVLGTLNVLEAARRCGSVKRIIYSASSSVYGNNTKMPLKEDMDPQPLNPYADSKLMAEMLVKRYAEFGVPGVSLRYFNVYGPRQLSDPNYVYTTVIGKFLEQWRKNLPFTVVPDGCQRRDFTYVSDVIYANILAMESDKVGKGEVINIGSGKNYSVFEVKDMINSVMGRKNLWGYIAPRRGEARETLADIKKAERLLGWRPKVSFEKGIENLKNK
jgi:UDP-glucose 4-epimerase